MNEHVVEFALDAILSKATELNEEDKTFYGLNIADNSYNNIGQVIEKYKPILLEAGVTMHEVDDFIVDLLCIVVEEANEAFKKGYKFALNMK